METETMNQQSHLNKKQAAVLSGILMCLLFVVTTMAGEQDSSGIRYPVQATYETASIQSMAVSRDGARLLCTMEKNGFPDLWLFSADPQKPVFPRRVTKDSSLESTPAFSPDGRFIAYTGTNYDVKGDIYLLNIDQPGSTPQRLTGRETGDGGACFDPAGRILYFHQIRPGETLPRIASIRLDDDRNVVHLLETGTDGSFPAVSPDGMQICYVSYQDDPTGAIMIYNLQTGTSRIITNGPEFNASPKWSTDGKTIFFSRIFTDTDFDQKITPRDNAVLYKAAAGQNDSRPYPMTRFDQTIASPVVGGGRIFFLSPWNRNINNCYVLPETGMIPDQGDGARQLQYSSTIVDNPNVNLFVKVLACSRVMEYDQGKEAAAASYQAGRILEDAELLPAATDYYQTASTGFTPVHPIDALARIAYISSHTRMQLARTAHADERSGIIESAMDQLAVISAQEDGISRARADIEQARLLLAAEADADSLITSIQILDSVIHSFPDLPSEIVEATILKAEILRRLGREEQASALYRTIIREFPEQARWVRAAVDKTLDYFLQSRKEARLEEKILRLRELSDQQQKSLPALAAGALNRAADLYVRDEQWTRAKQYYRLVLERFPSLPVQTAAARLALAEILYREERFREALDLYTAEIDHSAGSETVVALARRGYIRKSIAAGEYLFRIGEVPSAMNRFRELIDFQYGIVEAHRGYIKCAAALNRTEEVLKRYHADSMTYPESPIPAYGTALLLTYRDTRPALTDSKELLEKAIRMNGQIEYFHQTLGYVYEVLETVYGEKGNLEFALESYKKAYFLNDSQLNPENRAHLSLNIANIYYNLSQFSQALKYYTIRLDAGVPFDNPDTEILFYQRLGVSAFQSEDNRKTIAAFQQAVKLIQQAIDPYAPVRMCEKIHRFAMDEIIMPADKQEILKSAAQAIALPQADINRTLTAISENLLPPPSDEWNQFAAQIMELLPRQEQLFPDLLALLDRSGQADLKTADARKRLEWLALQVKKTLQHPPRMISLKAEMHDRLGLAFQENGQYPEAADQFEMAFYLNQRLGQNRNLAVNRRSVAVNRYMQSTREHGEERRRLLQQSAQQFAAALKLVDQYGVAAGSPDKGKEALLDLSLSVALDKKGATQAAHGFSPVQEKRLIAAFLSRINTELGRLTPAEAELQKQLSEYPIGKPVEDQDLYGVSLLYHRAGLLAAARKHDQDAFAFFEQSARLSRQYGNPVSTGINVMNMAHVYSRFSAADDGVWYNRLSASEKQAAALLQSSGVQDPLFFAGFCNIMGQYHLRFLENRNAGSSADISASVNRLILIRDAVSFLDRGIHILEEHEIPTNRNANAQLASLHLNMAIAGALIGENQHATAHFKKAAAISEENLLPDIEWRALAGIGRYADALKILSDITIMRAGCSPFEIMGSFQPLVAGLVQQNLPEEAFNLIERLSELERFNRLAFLFRNTMDSGKRQIQKLVPRIGKIRKLQSDIAGESSAEQRVYLKKQLLLETGLMDKDAGSEGENLPEMIRWIQDKDLQERCIILLGTAANAEDTADRLAAETDPAQKTKLKADYLTLIRQYHAVRLQMLDLRPETVSADIATFLGPEPAEAMDVMTVLPEEGRLIRLYQTDSDVYAFTLTPEEIILQQYASLAESISDLPTDRPVTIAYESPDEIPGQWACSLSATHFYRSMIEKKPFKNTIVAVPDAISDQEGYQVFHMGRLSRGSADSRATLAAGMNTLWLTGPISVSGTVPTRAQEKPDRSVVIKNQNGDPEPITPFLIDSHNLSLAVLTEYSPEDIFVIGNLFSLYHCPSLLLVREKEKGFSSAFFDHYRTNSIPGALNHLLDSPSDHGKEYQARLLGSPGMAPREADEFVQTYFVDIVKKGKKAFYRKQAGEAFSLFRNALEISQRFQKFQPLASKLMAYCRETAYQANDLAQAAHYAKMLADYEEAHHPDSEQHAEALLRFGLIESRQEKFETAISLLDEAVTILENLELEEPQVAALSELGKLLEHATEYDRALTVFRSAAEISDNIGQEELLADQHMNTGRIYDLRLSRYAAAIQYYRKALAIYRDMEEGDKIPQVLLDIGRCYRLLGNFPRADESFREALETVDQEQVKPQLRAKILIEQANNAWFQARYEKAFTLQRQAYEIAVNTESPLLQVICLNTSGLIWWTLGNQQKAGYELDKALAIAGQIPNRKDEVASTLNNIGLVLRETGRYETALETFDRALAIDENLQSKWAVAYDLRNKALTLLEMDRVADAVPLFEDSAAKSGEIGNTINEAKARLGLGDALRDLDRLQPARDSYQKALSLALETNLPETKWRAIFGLAQLDLAADPASAEKQLRDAIDVIESMRADIKIEQLKESFSDNKFTVYETLVRLLADKGKPEEAFEIAERSRARGFIDLLGNRHLNLNREQDQHLYDRQNRIRIRMDETRAYIAQSVESQERETYRKMLTDLEYQYQDALLEMQSHNPQLASMVSVSPLTAADIMGSLDTGTALLSYYVLDDELFCWLIRKGEEQQARGQAEITLFRSPINRKQFEADILAYRRIIQNLEPFETLSQSLYAVLLQQPAAQLEGIRKIGIIPHGSLHYLSFATLFNGNRFMIDDYNLFYLPSASVWKYTKGMRRLQKNIRVLAIGNPDLGDPSLDLPFAEHEVASIQWNFPRITVLTRGKASEEWVAENIGKFGIIHLASHGEFDPVNPLFSAIKLSHSHAFDGNLETSEIFGLPVNADMVVLSACQSGLGKVTGGDDVIGLNRAFFYAGTHTVVSSLWRVSDVATAMLIKTFYRRYAEHDKSESLRLAMLHVKNRYLHPGYWGAFTLVGDYR